MSRKAVAITLTVNERGQLERWSRGHQTPRSLTERAQIILLAAQGMRCSACTGLRKAFIYRNFPILAFARSRLSSIRLNRDLCSAENLISVESASNSTGRSLSIVPLMMFAIASTWTGQ